MRHWPGGRTLARFVVGTLTLLSAVMLNARSLRAQEITCDPGDREVRGLHFVGNVTFHDDDLSARVVTTASSATRRILRITGTKRCYPSSGLAADVSNLLNWYQNNGFFDTHVDTVVKAVSADAVDITFRISEGKPLILDTLRIEGLDSVPKRDEIVNGLQLKLGGRAGVVLMLADVDTIVNRLRNAGYPRADVFKSYGTHKAEHRAEIDLDVNTGPRARFGTIAVNSVNKKGAKPPAIDSAVVLRLIGFRTGDVYSDRALDRAQRNLYGLGTYVNVGVALDTLWLHGDTVADVHVGLREDRMRQFDLQEGWATLDCFRLNSGYTDKNFRGEAQQLSLTAQLSKLGYAEHASNAFTRDLCDRHALDPDSIASQKVNDHFGATIRQPNILGSHWSPSYSVYTERRGERQAYLRSTDLGFGVNATREIMSRTPLSLGYTFEHGSTHAETAILCGVFNRCTPQDQDDVQRSLPIAVASAALQRATTDNQIVPTRGYVAGIEVRYSEPWFASDPTQRFFKVTTDASWYRQLVSGVTFVGRVSGGMIRGGTIENGTRLPPPQERLYAGGAQSDRGYQQNELGPQVYLLDSAAFNVTATLKPGSTDTASLNYVAKPGSRSFRSIPVGGNTSVVVNAELRLRDPFFPNLFEYVPFLDAGQVWTGQIGKSRFNLNDLQYTPGLSVRYFSPIGPIQGNLGYNPYGSRAGQAFFAAPIDPATNKAPLICVTAPGETPLPVTHVSGQVVQDIAACPNTYVPAPAGGIFSRLRFTLAINANF